MRNIYLADSDEGTIVQWNTSGVFSKSYKPNKLIPTPSRLTRCSNGDIYVLTQQYSKKGIFHRVNNDGMVNTIESAIGIEEAYAGPCGRRDVREELVTVMELVILFLQLVMLKYIDTAKV